MAASVTITNHRDKAQLLGKALMRVVDLTFVPDGDSTYVMTDADIGTLGMRRVHQVVGPSILRDDTGTDVGYGVSWEIDDSTGVPTFFFWECGGAGVPMALNNASPTTIPAHRFTFIGV